MGVTIIAKFNTYEDALAYAEEYGVERIKEYYSSNGVAYYVQRNQNGGA